MGDRQSDCGSHARRAAPVRVPAPCRGNLLRTSRFPPGGGRLGYAETIAGTIYALAYLALIRVLVEYVWAAVGSVVQAVRARGESVSLRARLAEGNQQATERVRKGFLTEIILFAAFVFPVVWAFFAASDAASGKTASPSVFWFPFRAEAAIVHVDAPKRLGDGSCVLYLGQSDGVIALYDPATRTSWRVPTSDTVVETGGRLANVYEVPGDCPRTP